MPIVSKHVPAELSSSFYKNNKAICEEYETFINDIGGKTKGYYSCYSFNVLTMFQSKSKYKWNMRFQKFSYNQTYVFSKKSLLSELLYTSQWFSNNYYTNCPPFLITKGTFIQMIQCLLSKKWNQLPRQPNYIIKCENPDHPTIRKINDLLSKLYLSQEVYEIHYESPKLIIDIRSDKIHKNEMKNLLKL